MKLQDLDSQNKKAKALKVLESRLNGTINTKMGVRQARSMLESVQRRLSEYRASTAIHKSERDPNYLKLVVLENVLRAHLNENNDGVVLVPLDTKDPKVQQTMKKAQSGQHLTPDEQKTITAIASQKKEGSKTGRKRIVKESEVQQAQVTLAAQDLVDRVQGMLEDISEMQYKELPALVTSIRNDMGNEQASAFQQTVSDVLTQLLQGLQDGRADLESAMAVLTGQEVGLLDKFDGDNGRNATDFDDNELDDSDSGDRLPREDEDDSDFELPPANLGRARR